MVYDESQVLNRCCCAPEHSLYAKFYLKDESVEDPRENTTPVMTLEREGCDCCFTGPCPKPFLCCFACQPSCSDKASFYAGNIDFEASKPGAMHGMRETNSLIGESLQPLSGGGFKPVMQIMDRGDINSTKTTMFAATRGPCFFGGCSECCCDTNFGISVAAPESDLKTIHQLRFGDFATINKIKPKTLWQAARELFTDSDVINRQESASSLAFSISILKISNIDCFCRSGRYTSSTRVSLHSKRPTFLPQWLI